MALVVRVGVGVVVLSKRHPQSILIGIRKGSHGAGKWALPGGHLEVGESWAACAIRETEEETNLNIDRVSNITVTNDPNMDNGKHYVTIFMKGIVKDDSNILNNNEPNKCEEWKWVLWKDVVTMKNVNSAVFFEPMLNFIQEVERTNNTVFLDI